MTHPWPEVPLGEICSFRYGKALPAADRSGTGSPVYGSNGEVGLHSKSLVEGPAVVIGRKGSYGKVHYSDGPCWPIDTTYYVDQGSTTADLRWLFHRLPGLGLTELNRSAAVPGLNREDAYRRRLLLPPIEEQRRIAAILDAADEVRAKRRESLALANSLTEAIFLDMFGDPAANPQSLPTMPLSDLSVAISDGPFGSNLKSEHYRREGVRVVRLQNIGPGSFVDDDRAFIDDDHARRLGKHICRSGDVLIATMGDPNLRACLQPAWLPIAVNKADCVRLQPNPDRCTPAYVVELLNCPQVAAMASSLVNGQTRARISMGRLKTLVVPVPPLIEQQVFAARANEAQSSIESARAHLAKLDELFDSLQQRAFRGEL